MKLYAFAVCNSRLIGGGRLIAPSAIIDDGLLDVCLIEGMSAMEFVNLARKVADGDHVDDPRVRYFQASSLVIDLEPEAWINTDGEVLSARRCEYTVQPGAATFLAGDAPFSTASRPRGLRSRIARSNLVASAIAAVCPCARLTGPSSRPGSNV